MGTSYTSCAPRYYAVPSSQYSYYGQQQVGYVYPQQNVAPSYVPQRQPRRVSIWISGGYNPGYQTYPQAYPYQTYPPQYRPTVRMY